MPFEKPLSDDLEEKAKALVARVREKTEDELLTLARLLVSRGDHELFGDTEFEVRDIVHRIGSHAYEAHLAEKKTATKDPASSAPAADSAPSSKAIERKRP